jgi:hypothetical protein
MTPSRVESVEKALATLLDGLALTLIELNVTPARLAQIARASFVKAGASQATKRSSGRLHLARIAALTGLSRAEVKRIVSTDFAVGRSRADSLPRALRVFSGWQKSKRYSQRGKPRTLAMLGPAPSFESLCQEYSGDIPHRVILSELERGGYVEFDPRRKRVKASCKPRARGRSSSAEAALAFAASFIAESFRQGSVLVRKRQRAYISSSLPASYAESAIAGRVTEMLDQIPRMFPSARKGKKCAVDVFALVSRKTEI